MTCEELLTQINNNIQLLLTAINDVKNELVKVNQKLGG